MNITPWKKSIFVVAAAFTACMAGSVAKAEPYPSVDMTSAETGEFTPNLPIVIVVDQEKHHTHLYQMQEGTLVDVLSVPNSTGKPSTPTPNCKARITAKILDPVWTPPKSIDPQQRAVQPYSKTHSNPLGTAFLRLNIDSGMIALHGTNAPRQIGKFVSHGCIRHLNDDILKINKMVSVGTPVHIVQNLTEADVQIQEFYPVHESSEHNMVASHREMHSTIPLN